jgi:hypothetical protein
MRGSRTLALNNKVPECTITDLKYGRPQDKAVQYSIITLWGGGGGFIVDMRLTPLGRSARQPAERRQTSVSTVMLCPLGDVAIVTARVT